MATSPGFSASPGRARSRGTRHGFVAIICVSCLGIASLLAYYNSHGAEAPDSRVQPRRLGPKYRRVLNVHENIISAQTDQGSLSMPVLVPEPKWEQTAEAMFQRGVERRHRGLQQLINAPFNPWDINRGVYIWVCHAH